MIPEQPDMTRVEERTRLQESNRTRCTDLGLTWEEYARDTGDGPNPTNHKPARSPFETLSDLVTKEIGALLTKPV
jgi:hypothetical protein